MNKIILLPLADGQSARNIFSTKTIQIHSSECDQPFNKIFFAQIGKMLHFYKTNKQNFDQICFIQNRRYFNDLDKFQINDPNIVYLAKAQNFHCLTIQSQFETCHRNHLKIFNQIIQKSKIKKELLNSITLCPHNIFCASKTFFDQYCQFLIEYLVPYYNQKQPRKIGAWLSERLLHLFAHQNFKVEQKDITILKK